MFRMSIFDKVRYIKGTIVRCIGLKDNVYGYGVKFAFDKAGEAESFKIFNKLSLVINKYPKNSGCNFCSEDVCPCEKML